MNTTEIIEQINLELEKLQQIVKSSQNKLQTLPAGTLEVRNRKGTNYYIKYLNGKRTSVSSNQEEIESLEERNYYTSLVKAAAKETESLKKAIAILEKSEDIDKVFFTMPQSYRHLILPYVQICDEKQREYIEKDKTYNRVKESNYITSTGVKVRSKSELIIAERFTKNNIPYVYEPIMILNDLIQIWRPDFQVLNKRTGKLYYWEHFGMLDNKTYCDDFQFKIEKYALCGFFPGENLIITTESTTHPLSTKHLDLIITKYLK